MRRRYVAIAASALLAVGACSSEQEPTRSSVDITKLDAGNYPTKPIDVEALRDSSSGSVRESVRIGNSTPVPYEYDSRLAYGLDYNRSQIITPAEPPYPDEVGIKVERKNFTNEFPGLVAGWRTHATRRSNSGEGRGIDTWSVRFDTPENARNAAAKMAGLIPGSAHTIDGHPGAQTKVTPAEPGDITPKMRSWLAHEDMLIYLQISDPVSRPFEIPDNAEIVKKFYDKQIERLRGYSRTPIQEIPRIPLDVDGLLSHTLPADKVTSRIGVYPTHVVVSQAALPVAAASAYADAGVDYIVSSGAFVYRAKDAAAAERLSAAFVGGTLSPELVTAEASPPPHMPNAKCNSGDPNRSTPPSCSYTVGRYLVRVGGANLQDVYQRAAAQYLLLADLG
ncbi:hypothetical protein [Nocardia sp. A7]|uniref:DUF7373 family lipoprotein n=1 Tax=Nocardia sp. A7 TaxID=2789274 RepID=UPI00397DDE4B